MSVSIKGQPKQKNTVVAHRRFKIGDREAPCVSRSGSWTYLGVKFTPDGRRKVTTFEDLGLKIQRLSRAPLKPQQRMFALRTFLIPMLYHQLTLGGIHLGCLRKIDSQIRLAIRRWLVLPPDVPNAYFHSSVADGGLGIPSIRWQAPLIRLRRLRRIILPNLEGNMVADSFLLQEISICERRLREDGIILDSKAAVELMWRRKLYAAVDGNGLREAYHHPYAHRWVREPTRLLSGRDYLNCIRMRINALPTRSRTTRGRLDESRLCRAGCVKAETLNHVLQTCPRTRSSRIIRHNSVVKYMKKELVRRGFHVYTEPHIHTVEGLRKPDLIAETGDAIKVCDVQIVTDGWSLDDADSTKIQKYNTEAMRGALHEKFGRKRIDVAAVTLNWRGVWSRNSMQNLLELNVLRKKDAALISTRVVIGGLIGHRRFMRAERVGVG